MTKKCPSGTIPAFFTALCEIKKKGLGVTNPGYTKIEHALSDGRYLYVSFADGSTIRLDASDVLPPEPFEKIDWSNIRVEHEGLHITIPAEPRPIEMPWSVLRALSDINFALRLATAARNQQQWIGHRLHRLRERSGLSQEDVATRLGIPLSRYRAIEKGEESLLTPFLIDILSTMGCAMEDLAEREE